MEKILDRTVRFRIGLASLVVMLSVWTIVFLAGGSGTALVVGVFVGVVGGFAFAAFVAWTVYIAKGPAYAELLTRVEQREQLDPAERILLGVRVVPWGEIFGFFILASGIGLFIWIGNGFITEIVMKCKFERGGSISNDEVAMNLLIYWLFALAFSLTLFKRCWKKFEMRFLKATESESDCAEQMERKAVDEKSVSLRTFKVISPKGDLEEMTIGPFARDEKLAKLLASRLELKIAKVGDSYVLEGFQLERDALLAKIREVAPDAVIVTGAA